MGPVLALVAFGCLVGAGWLGLARRGRRTERATSAGQFATKAALLNLVPGLGFWLVLHRPKAALLNAGFATLALAAAIWLRARRGDPGLIIDGVILVTFTSVIWAHQAALRKLGLGEGDLLEEGRPE